ncbi:glycosyltransferase family 4 protein [bacterium]|nr:glycosyltransferase family 4 protein [bacterium]
MNSQKRIALLHYSCPPVIGGVEFVLEAHARLLAGHGHWAKIIAGRGQSFSAQVQVEMIPEMRTLNDVDVQLQGELDEGVISGRFHDLKDKLMARLRPSLVPMTHCIVHNVMTMPFNLVLTAALHELIDELSPQTKFIIWCHDAALRDPNYAIKRRNQFPWDLLGKANPLARYVTISKLRARQITELMGLSPDQMTVVPNGVDLRSFLGIADCICKLATDHALLEARPVMLFPSRILRRKNYQLAIRIVAALKKQGHPAKLLLTGPPDPHNPQTAEYARELRQLCAQLKLEDDVLFVSQILEAMGQAGKIGFGELRSLYAIADLLLITSSQEGFGLPLLEAGSLKLPIVCSDIPPFREVAPEDALFFDLQEEPAQIASRIIAFLQEQPAHRMFKRVLGQYSWERIYEVHLEGLVG